MSNKTYDEIWKEAIHQLRAQTTLEIERTEKCSSSSAPSSSSQNDDDIFRHCATLYVNYVRIFERLEQCHDGIIQPQKRIDVKKTLELVIGRVIELRHQLSQLSDTCRTIDVNDATSESLPSSSPNDNRNLNFILHELKIPPDRFVVPIPRFFKEDNAVQRGRRDALVEGYMKMKLGKTSLPIEQHKNHNSSSSSRGDDDPSDDEIGGDGSSSSSVGHIGDFTPPRVIGNARHRHKRNKKKIESSSSSSLALDEEDDSASAAALVIQRVFRGATSRKRTADGKTTERIFLGMVPSSSIPNDNNDDSEGCEAYDIPKSVLSTSFQQHHHLSLNAEKAYKVRKQEQARNAEEFEMALIELKNVVREEEGYEMQERLREERTRWITQRVAETNNIPDSLVGFYENEKVTTEEGKEEAEEPVVEDPKDKKGKKGDNKKGKKESESDNQNDDPSNNIILGGVSSTFTNELQQSVENYDKIWHNRPNNVNNGQSSSQKHDPELAKDIIVRDQVQEELTKHVDEMLVMNLTKIKALQSSSGTGAKIAELKNLDSDYMLSLLVENGIINNPRKDVKLTDFVGTNDLSSNYFTLPNAPEKKMAWNTPLSELRTLLTEYCILPLGSASIKRKIPPERNIRSLMLYGPSGSGKTLLAEAIASELGALFVNLSPVVTNGKFTEGGKTGATKLIHMAFSIAKDPTFAPVVIYIDDCDQFFQPSKKKKKKGVPPVDKNGPVRFQKDLLIYKNQSLTAADRAIVVGSTTNPENADFKLLRWKGAATGKPEKQGFFEKVLYIPHPTYVDRRLLWKSDILAKFNASGGSSRRSSSRHLRRRQQQQQKQQQKQQQQRGTTTMTTMGEDAYYVPDLDWGSLSLLTEGYTAGMIQKRVNDVLTPARIQKCENGKIVEEDEFLMDDSRMMIVKDPLKEGGGAATPGEDNDREEDVMVVMERDNIKFLEFAQKVMEAEKPPVEGGGKEKEKNKKGGDKKKGKKKK